MGPMLTFSKQDKQNIRKSYDNQFSHELPTSAAEDVDKCDDNTDKDEEDEESACTLPSKCESACTLPSICEPACTLPSICDTAKENENKENILLTTSNSYEHTSISPCKFTVNELSSNCRDIQERFPSKRKLSMVNLPSAVHDNNSSSDDEIKDLCSRRSERNIADDNSQFSRHRRKFMCIKKETSRPSLNFEKMQQKLLRRQRPRFVRVKAVNPFPTYSSSFPTLDQFKPIGCVCGVNSLTPVEKPIHFKSSCAF